MDFSVEDACNNPQLLDQLHKAFANIGFVFVTNHGIDKQKVWYGFINLYSLIPHLISLA